MNNLEEVLAELDWMGKVPEHNACAVTPEQAREFATIIRASLPKVWAAETIKDAWVKGDEMALAEFAYIGVKPCGCVVSACADSPEHREDTKQFVMDEMDAGMNIERVSIEDARLRLKRCTHEAQP